MTTPVVVTDPLVEHLAAQLAGVQAAKTDLEVREADLKARLRDALPEPGTFTAGGLKVEVQRNRRFNPDAALPLLSDADVLACTVSTLDPKAVKARLTPLQLEDCMKTVGDNKIVLR